MPIDFGIAEAWRGARKCGFGGHACDAWAAPAHRPRVDGDGDLFDAVRGFDSVCGDKWADGATSVECRGEGPFLKTREAKCGQGAPEPVKQFFQQRQLIPDERQG